MGKTESKDNISAALLAALPPDWPRPDADALAHSRRLTAHIRAGIERDGPLDFGRYMHLALYAPGLGYYSAGARKFGAAGDFVTAPELSPLFAACLARQIAETLAAVAGDTVLELGAGSGVLAAELLTQLRYLDTLPERYWILEPSADLRERSRATIEACVPDLASRVVWLKHLPEAPLTGVIFGNEILDALPVRRFRAPDRALAVTWAGDRFDWVPVPADAGLGDALTALEADLEAAFPPGYESEYPHRLRPWIAGLADCLNRGMMLFVDYGMSRREFYHPERTAGTLMCHYRHRAHGDPFLLPGLQDITAHVDFTAVAEAGVASDLDLAGYTTQAHFLLGCGLDEVLSEGLARDGLGSRAQIEAARDAKLLMLPDEMGERFKAIALGRGLTSIPRGFGVRDLAARL